MDTQRTGIDQDKMNALEETLKTISETVDISEVKKLPHEFIQRLWTIGIAAIGLVAALAWDRFLRELINMLFSKGDSLWVLFAYAVAMTFVAAFIAINLPWIERWYIRHIRKKYPYMGDIKKQNQPHIPIGESLK